MDDPGTGKSAAKKLAVAEVLRLEYERRINRALEYIQNNLDGDLSLEAVSRAAAFSPYHFHRIFRALAGQTIREYVQRRRLNRAARRLVFDLRASITDIALDCGFSSSSAFARSFKDSFGVSASEFRKNKGRIDSKKCKEVSKNGKDTVSGFVDDGGRKPQPSKKRRSTMKVEVKEMPEYRVVYVRHMGGYEYEGISETWGRLCKWAGPRGLLGPETVAIGVSHDDPKITPPDKCRYDACIAVGPEVEGEGEVGIATLPAGQYAVTRYEGKADGIEGAYHSLFGGWFPASGYQPGDSPSYEVYRNDPDKSGGFFVMDICVPVKPL